jgi:3-dehydroquinate synthase
MVDAAIGGKNGIDVGVYKNMAGIIRQPRFLLYDPSFLQTLPATEWRNGFAEIIKHACIKDSAMFSQLERGSLEFYQSSRRSMLDLIKKNVLIKTRVVQKDEFEKNERRLLNFGHTLGHALENQYELSHGQAVSIGMTYACHFSEKLLGFRQTGRVVAVLEQYGLPTYASFKKNKVINVLMKDKKREKATMNYVLLEKIGKGTIKNISLKEVEEFIQEA